MKKTVPLIPGIFSLIFIMSLQLSAAHDFQFYTHGISKTSLALKGLEQEEDVFHEELLVKVISEPEDGIIHDFVLGLDDNTNDLLYVIRKSPYGEGTHLFQDLVEKPVPVAKASDRDVLFLHCPSCTKEDGGPLTLKYLYNGLTKAYKSKVYFIERQEDGHWGLFTEAGFGDSDHKINTLTLKPRIVAGTLLGIKDIVVNEKKKSLSE